VSAAVPVTVPDVAELLGVAALEELDEPVPLAVVLPLNGVAADVLPPAAAAVDDVEVW
jgi:hypothetical protein